MTAAARIASLHVYPVKSCRGIDVTSARLVPTGIEWDRRWMIVDSRDRFITQRSHPRLTAISVAIGTGRLRLATDGQDPLVLDPEHGGPRRSVRIWDDDCTGIDAGEDASDWLLALLGEPLRLVRIDDAVPRLAERKYVGTEPQPVAFSDGYPIQLISMASLAELNRRLPSPVPMNRFRPNIVIEGVPAHAEDAMTEFRAGTVVLRGVKHCTRCATTTTDQRSGARDPDQEPLRTLGTYRHDRKLRGVTFGQNCRIVSGVGARLTVGDELTIGAPA